jgi:hypothetical protein
MTSRRSGSPAASPSKASISRGRSFRGALAAGELPPPVGVGLGQGAHAEWDHHHPLGIGAERIDDLARHEVRLGVHPGTPPQGPVDQVGVLERVGGGHLGVVMERQVVDGHHLSRVAARGHHVVRAVHDVDRSGPPLDRRQVGAPPQHPQRPSRLRPGCHLDPRRDQRGELAPTPPRGGIGDRCDLAERQVGEELGREHADAGPWPEQRRGIDRDAESLGHLASWRDGRAVSWRRRA